jgi:hypothetical protein
MNGEFVGMAILCFSKHCRGDILTSLRITRALLYLISCGMKFQVVVFFAYDALHLGRCLASRPAPSLCETY